MTESVPFPDIPELPILVDKIEYENASSGERAEFEHNHRQLREGGYVGHGKRATAPFMVLDLSDFQDFAEYIAQCRRVHKGNAVRDGIRAARHGYYTHFFNRQLHLDDILAVTTSGPERQGRSLGEGFFLTPEQQGGYPAAIEPEAAPTGALGWERNFGVFLKDPDYTQGPHRVGEQLVAYGHLRRYANAVLLNRFIGHKAHLANGIVYKMHFDLIERIYNCRATAEPTATDNDSSLRGIRYVVSGGYAGLLPDGVLGRSGGGGLLRWKLRVLYRPVLFRYDGG